MDAFAQGRSKASQNLVSLAFERDVKFWDPWVNPYIYEYQRKDGIGGFRLFPLGPDGKTGKGHSEDDIPIVNQRQAY